MKIQKLKQPRLGKLKALIALLLIAGVGSYLVFSSRAAEYYLHYRSPVQIRWTTNGNEGDAFVAPLGSNLDSRIDISFVPFKPPRDTLQTSVYFLFPYNPEMIRFLGSTCEWKYGCTIKVGDDLYSSAAYQDEHHLLQLSENPRTIWKAQVLMCFNIPANPVSTPFALAGTYRFKRTNVPMPPSTNPVSGKPHEDTVKMHKRVFTGTKQESCDANPEFKGIDFVVTHVCSTPNDKGLPKCNGLSDPGIGGAALTGFGNGGNGNGGEGTGDTGVGNGPGAGSGGGGGGSSANRQADKPNSLPSPSPQGENEQTELDPDPFFDGKDFKKGSDTDNLVFGNSTIGGKKVPKLVLYLISALLLGGAGGALYWRWKRKGQ